MKISKTPTKPKIPRILLSLILFIIIFITFTVIIKPHTVYAAGSFVTSDGTEWVTAPTELPWAGSADRQGVVFYLTKILHEGSCVKDTSVIPFTLLASNKDNWRSQVDTSITYGRAYGVISSPTYIDSGFHYPATYTEDGSWVSTGGDTKAYLEEETASGRQQWEITVGQKWGYDKVDEIKKDRGETRRICMESTSAFILYQNKDGEDYQALRYGSPYKIYGTVFDVACRLTGPTYGMDITRRTGSGSIIGTANYKWFQSIANGMVLSDEEEARILGIDTAQMKDVSISDMQEHGYGFGTIKPTLTPIHTCNGHTPGDPEEPIPNVTDGKCTIYKLYYTVYYDKDGNETKVEYKPPYKQTKTTNYIVIDSEPGYTVEMWKTRSGGSPAYQRETIYAITPTQMGHGGGEVVLNINEDGGGENTLYVLLKKIEVDTTPPSPQEDFLIEESQITRRISFEDSAKTLELLSHEFVFESAAPNKSYEI